MTDLNTENIPGFLFIDHLAIAVPTGQLENQVNIYKTMGFKELHRETMEGGDLVNEVLLQIGDGPNLIQLLEPLNDNSPVAKQIKRNNGKGSMAHVGYRVKNAQLAFDYMKEKGFNIIDKAPRAGSRGTTVFFVHPKTTADTALSVLIEVVEE